MLTSRASLGWALVKPKWIVSSPLESTFTYGRSPVPRSASAARSTSAPSGWVEKVGL